MRKNPPVDDATRTQRALNWDTSIPELVTRTLAQWREPLESVVGPSNKPGVLGILSEAAQEQYQQRPFYAAFVAHDPWAVRHAALADEARLESSHYVAYHNAERCHSALGYKSPNHFEIHLQTTSQVYPA
ncbi:hypothetical protein [Hymenobacter elongatus]|uniref:Uncharacterized protein n=1 Tax=Hymenobacter elongatus TaxID=877208 RepID=A0A4Z0PP02_9BACT|nr:hypothetical protein [Hymenobacter elongatus]TGE18991.1 hypothetical protein E5J99_04400 [Hymenobacter elongatus]